MACQLSLEAATLAIPSSVELVAPDVPRADSRAAVVELAAWLSASWIAAAPDEGVAVVADAVALAAGAVEAAAPDADDTDDEAADAAVVPDESVAAELLWASCACT